MPNPEQHKIAILAAETASRAVLTPALDAKWTPPTPEVAAKAVTDAYVAALVAVSASVAAPGAPDPQSAA